MEPEAIGGEGEGLSTTGLLSCFSLDVEGSITSPLARFRFLNFLLLFLRALSKAALIGKVPPWEDPPGETRAQANPVDVAGVATNSALRHAPERPEVVASLVVPEDALEDFAEEHVPAPVVFANFPEDASGDLAVDFPHDIPEDAPSEDAPELPSGEEPDDRPEEVTEVDAEKVLEDLLKAFPEAAADNLPEGALDTFPLVLSPSPF